MQKELMILNLLNDIFKEKNDKDKLMNLYYNLHKITYYIRIHLNGGWDQTPGNLPDVLKYLDEHKLGEFVPSIAQGFEDERILIESLKDVSSAVKEIIEKHKTV